MGTYHSTRRQFIKTIGAGAAALAIPATYSAERGSLLEVNPEPRFNLSPYLYMQFMEPLGTTDGSVAAAWDFKKDRWRPDVIEVTKKLAPSLIRWGGCFSSYYRWKEAVGPRDQRKPMINLLWGGIESNQVGTHEFVDFCRQVGADALMSVNFESDGRKNWQRGPKGEIRSAGPEEAADWVEYCNNPDSRERIKRGIKEPYNIRLWQLGNETSYDRNGYDCETAAKRTVAFAQAMRRRDPDIELIGWGDSGWAHQMLDIADEHLQYIAFHHMFNPDRGIPDSPLRGIEYRKDPARTWRHLMNAAKVHEEKIKWMKEQVADYPIPLAMTECHFSLPGRNRCEVLSTWAAGVANARMLNVHERHGDRLKIATLADFCGTRWQVNAVMIPVPGGKSFMMPVGLVMSLYRHHTGAKAVDVNSAHKDLDVTASRTGNRIYLHIININRDQSIQTSLRVDGMKITSGRIFELAADPEFEVIQTQADEIVPKEKSLPVHPLGDRSSGVNYQWTFPPASVSAVELDVQKA